MPDDGDLAERLDRLELAIEQAALGAKLGEKFTEYCHALKQDQQALTIIRWIAVIGAFLIIVGLFAALGYFMLFRGVLFWLVSDTAKAAIIIAVVGGAIALLIVILRGSFRTIAERNKDDVVPEHLKALYETVRTAMGRD